MPWRPGAALVVALALTLTACTTPTPAPSSGSPTPSPTPTPTVAPIVEPEPAIDLDCEDAVPLAALQGALGADWAPAEQDWASGQYGIPDVTWLLQAGGVACAWSSATSEIDGYSTLSLWVLPDGAAGWARFNDVYGCDENPAMCPGSFLVGDRWVDFYGPTLPDSILAAASATIEAAPARAAAAWPPPSVTPLPAECDDLVSAATVTSATGSTVPIYTGGPHGGYSMWFDLQKSANNTTCIWSWEDADAGVGTMQRLTGGIWAWERTRAAVDADPEQIELAGLNEDDSAWLHCGELSQYTNGCRLDLIVGGNWLKIEIYEDDGSGLAAERVSVPPEESILVIGEAAVAGVNGS